MSILYYNADSALFPNMHTSTDQSSGMSRKHNQLRAC